MPDIEERFWRPYRNQGLQVVVLNSREPTTQIGLVQAYIDSLGVTFPVGFEEPPTTYAAVIANYPGPNPFPVEVIVGKDGVVHYAAHEYDPDAMAQVLNELLVE